MPWNMMRSSALVGSFLCWSASTYAAQPDAARPVAAPLRELPWAQLNFLHTTDTHGWHAGHLREPSFSADWGDYISFAHHLHARADAEGVDLLLVDTGDRIEGNGLYDASEPKGFYTYEIFKEQDIDLITTGNHELYKQNASNNEFHRTVPNFKGNYLASNLDIYNPDTGELQPLARRFKKFTTKNQGIRILAFGFIFNFKGNANNTVITTVENTIQKEWFQDAIQDTDIDLIVIFGHVAIRSLEYQHLYKAIRSVRPNTPIQFFAGHSHIRDYQVYDDKSVSLESGRYMETIGFMSIDGLNAGGKSNQEGPANPAKSLRFSRRYIDNNLYSLMHHSRTNVTTFPTPHGKSTSVAIEVARKAMKLNKLHGCAPQNYYVNRAPYPSPDSIFSLLQDHIFPEKLLDPTRKGKSALVLMNTGSMRFDIFKGPYTRDTDYQVMPFTGGFKFVKDISLETALRVLDLLNDAPVLQLMDDDIDLDPSALAPPEQKGRSVQRVAQKTHMHNDIPGIVAPVRGQVPLAEQANGNLQPGYTTHDDAGSDGDDTLHSSIEYYDVPNCIQASIGFPVGKQPEVVDLVINDFLQPYALLALQYLGQKVTQDDFKPYMEGMSFTDLIPHWVEENWSDCSAWE